MVKWCTSSWSDIPSTHASCENAIHLADYWWASSMFSPATVRIMFWDHLHPPWKNMHTWIPIVAAYPYILAAYIQIHKAVWNHRKYSYSDSCVVFPCPGRLSTSLIVGSRELSCTLDVSSPGFHSQTAVLRFHFFCKWCLMQFPLVSLCLLNPCTHTN